jgi:predicted MFS family arabinose efflux permease
MALLQEVIKRDLSLTDWQIGLLSGPAFAIFHSFVGLPVARIAERTHRPRLLSIAVIVWSGMTTLCAAASSFLMLGLCRIGVGMGEGGCNPVSHSLVADNFSVRQRGVAMAVLSAGSPIAGIMAPLLAGAVALHWGWRAAFIAVGAPGFLIAVLLWLTVKEPSMGGARRQAASFLTDFKWLARNRAFVSVFIAGALNGIAIQGTLIFTASYVMRSYGLNIAQAGGVLSLRGAMGLLGTFIGGWLADRFADSRGRSYVLVPAFGAALSFLLFIGAFSVQTWAVALTCLMAANVATDLKNGPNFAAVQNIVPSRMRATAAAMFFLAATVVGTAVGAALVGGVSDRVATHLFPAQFGVYTVVCPGNHAMGAAAQACAVAASQGLRSALFAISFFFLGSMSFFYVASRSIEVNTD